MTVSPMKDDGARLKQKSTPRGVRDQANADALVLGRGACDDFELSLEWLAIDHPQIAGEYETMLNQLADYVARLENITRS